MTLFINVCAPRGPSAKRRLCAFALLSAFGILSLAMAAAGPELDAPTAITNANVITPAGERLEKATVLMRDGRIVAVGTDVKPADGTRLIDASGMFVYPAFVDGFSRAGVETPAATAEQERRVEDDWPPFDDGPHAATVEANRNGIYARRTAHDLIDIQESTFDKHRQAGFASALTAGPRAILGGTASLIQLGTRPLRRSTVLSDVAHTASFDPPGNRAIGTRGRYPSTAFGAIAHFRQTLLDARWHRDMAEFAAKNPEFSHELRRDEDLSALQAVLDAKLPVLWEANTADEIHRALNLAEEFKFRPILVGAREAWKVADRLKTSGVPVIVSLRLPEKVKEYKLEPDKLRKKPDDDTLYGKGWDKRPFLPKSSYEIEKRRRDEIVRNPARLEEAGIAWCFSTIDMKDVSDALDNVREMVEAGLPADAALRGLTSGPARLLGIERELGAIRPGARGNITVLTKAFGEKDAKVRWTFVEGRKFEFSTSAESRKKDGDGDRRGRRGRGAREKQEDEEKEEEGEEETGEPDEKQPGQEEKSSGSTKSAATSAPADAAASRPAEPGPHDDVVLHEPAWPTETEIERKPSIQTGGSVLLANATLLTVSGEDLPNASVLIEKGKITAVGKNLTSPPGVPVFDLPGLVIMPGIIDPHAHIAIDSVNEGTQSVTPEVRCEDVVRHDDPNIYRALTGGTTTVHSMHGSANAIGGQNVTLKLKYGRPAGEMIIPDRARTVKFALGENVKRGGMPGRSGEQRDYRRFPGTRMGVETTMRRAFSEARRYADQSAEFAAAQKSGRPAKPVRRDLRLEALADILAGRIWVHCHCYRADEILRLLSVAEDFGFRICTLQHVLEGYRVMPEVLRHGCGTSTFADWWAYKIEAYNAIPQNAGMMQRYGINATINSDSADLMRHLNFEAAKCLKYSGLTANEALRLITLNGARQLGVDHRVGSIDVGKDGDIAIFNGHPFDTFAKCVMTLIEGEVYFQDRGFDPLETKAPGERTPDSPAGAAGLVSARPLKDFSTLATGGPRAKAGIRTDGSTNGLVAALPQVAAAAPAAPSGPARTTGAPSDDTSKSDAKGEPAGRLETDRQRGPHAPSNESDGPAARGGAASEPTAPAVSGAYAIVNATIHPVSSPVISKGVLVLRDGKIAAVGPDVKPPAGATVIDATGRHVYPGLINAGSAMGLHEIGQVDVTVDTNEPGTYQPDVTAVSAFNPFSAMVEVTRAEGVLTSLALVTTPAVAGQAGVLDLDGWSMSEMLVEPRGALVVSLPSKAPEPITEREERRRRGRRAQQQEEDEEGDEAFQKRLRELADFFTDAQIYARSRHHALIAQQKPPLPQDSRFDAMMPYLLGNRPVIFVADEYKAILEAVLFAEQFDLKPIIFGGREAWKAADVLAKRNVPVIYDAVFSVPGGHDTWDSNYRALGELARAGVKFCTATRDASLAKLLPVEAGFAVAHGLDPEAAVRAITLSAAEILGIDHAYGSLDVGKVANVIITTDHPCQVTNVVTHAFVRGRPIPLDSQHTRFADKWASRPPLTARPLGELKGPPSQGVTR